MSEVTYCPNCNQNVTAEKKGGSGASGGVLLIISIILLFLFWPLGVLLLIAAVICIVVAIIEGIANAATGQVGTCPLCKTNLTRMKVNR